MQSRVSSPHLIHRVTRSPLPRKTKGQIRKDLTNEYEALGRPGAGKTLAEVMQAVEDDMSKNLEFKIEKSGKILWLHCGKRKVQLPDKGWKLQIFKEPSGIPFLSTGKLSQRCVHEVQDTPAKAKVSVEVSEVPLPGGATTPSTAIPGTSVAPEADQGLCLQKTLGGNLGKPLNLGS